MKKHERYGWEDPGDPGDFDWLPIKELKIHRHKDGGYQRDEVSKSNTLSISRGFKWEAVNSIVVFVRKNGDKFIVDGQQRFLAASNREDIQRVPCRIFKSKGLRHEAATFLLLNNNRKNVKAVSKFYAAVIEGDPVAVGVFDFLNSLGLIVGDDGKNNNHISFPTRLLSHWRADAEATKAAILAQKITFPDESLHNNIHIGFYYLIRAGVPVEQYSEKFVRGGGRPALLGSIKKTQIESGLKARSERICALGILEIINRGCKKRIYLPSM